MITEKDLQEAIAECQGTRNPTSSTCIKLAAYLTLKEHLYGVQSQKQPEIEIMPRYSYASGADRITYDGESEFAQTVNGRRQDEVMPVIEELMETVKAINPRLYASAIRKLQ